MKHLYPYLLLLAAIAWPTAPARAQSPAELAPADTQVYLHIADFDVWFDRFTQGPSGQATRAEMEQSPQWQVLLALLEMDSETFFATYFGGDVVIFAPEAREDAGGFIFSRVELADAEHARDRLFLEPAGAVGDAALYQTADGGGYVAILPGWVALCDAAQLDDLRAALDGLGGGDRLASHADFAEWTGMLPDDRGITVYLAAGEHETHALGITAADAGLDIAYFGASPAFDELLAMLGESPAADFGPLPADTLAAAAFTLAAPGNTGDDELLAGLDMLAAPASFVGDILPKLGGPSVVFMGDAGADADEPGLPVLGMALRMDDDTVADDLNAMMDKTMLLANLATLQWETDPVRFNRGEYLGNSYRVADIGGPLAQHTGWPEFASVKVVYGRVGDYFMVCTDEPFFKQCVDTHRGEAPLHARFAGPVHDRAATPILSIAMQPEGLADMMRTWQQVLGNEGLGLNLELDVPLVQSELGQNIQLLDQFDAMTMQVWRGDDGLVAARILMTTPE